MDPQLARSVRTLVKTAVVFLALLSVYLLFRYVLPLAGAILVAIPGYVLPFLVALLLALLIEPLARFLNYRLRLRRGWAVFLSLLLVWGTAGFLLTYLVSRLIGELIGLYKVITEHSLSITNTIARALGQAELFYLRLNLPDNVQESIRNSLLQYLSGLEKILSGSVDVLIDFLVGLPGLFVFFLISTVATFFILRDWNKLRSGFFELLPDSWKITVRTVIKDLFNAFTGFLKAYSLLVTVTGIETIVGLKLLGVEYALTLGLVTGLLDILPVLGPGALFVPWIIFSYITGASGFATGLLVLYGILVAVRQVLEPKLVGDSIGLHPLATLVSLYIGLKLLGPAGLVLGPVTVILYLACQRAGVFQQLANYIRKV
ncbi:MAG TPA: sporulation integral membrane protein YtvI [Syntrophothermus lipocalidus]|nr:sporulation integral membrane protein YtvI [Syntrophothermus lipocalidus]